MAYCILFAPAAKRQLVKFPADVQSKVVSTVDCLADNPRPPGTKKLKGEDTWRIRVNDYRIMYNIYDDAKRILILKIVHRSEAYKR